MAETYSRSSPRADFYERFYAASEAANQAEMVRLTFSERRFLEVLLSHSSAAAAGPIIAKMRAAEERQRETPFRPFDPDTGQLVHAPLAAAQKKVVNSG